MAILLDNKLKIRLLQQQVFYCVRYIIVLCLLLIHLCIVFPLFYLYRALVVCFVKCFKSSELVSILDPMSHLFVDYGFVENAPTRANMVCVLEIKGNMRKEQVTELFDKNVLSATVSNSALNSLKYPQLKMYPSSFMGYWFWKYESQFKTEDHIKECPEQNCNSLLSVSAIHEYILNDDPLPENKSPWDVTLFRKSVDCTNAAEITTFVAIRMHHCMGGAKSLLKLIVHDLGQKTVSTAALPKPGWPSGDMSSWYLRLIILLPFTMVRIVLETMRLSKLSTGHPWQMRNPDSDSSRFIVKSSRQFDISKIKAAAGKHGEICFSAVLLAAVTGAARNFTEKHGEKWGKDCGLSVALALPKPNHPEKLTNHFEGTLLEAPTNVSCYKERLGQCHRIYMDTKNAVHLKSSAILANTVQYLVRPLKKNMKLTSNYTTTFTNLAGEKDGFSIGEFPCLDFSFSSSPLRGTFGVVFKVMSYRERFRITVVANESVMTEAECGILTTLLEQEIDSIWLK